MLAVSKRIGFAALLGVLPLFACTTEDGVPDSQAVAENDRGVALMGQYDYTAAETVFAAVADREPGWLDARVNLAIATLNRQNDGDERLALDILGTVLAEDPDQARALYTSAILHLYLGEAEPAAAALARVTDLDPGDAYAAYFLGQALLQSGDEAGAAERFLASIEIDPYLRSAYWAGSQALRRVDRADEAAQLLAEYQRFETNPAARLAGFSYARMGPKAQALATSPAPLPRPVKPEGALFGDAQRILDLGVPRAASVSTAFVDDDQHLDLVVASGGPLQVLLGDGEGAFARTPEHPLAAVANVAASLWGDLDDDGLVDAVLCGPEGAQYWRQANNGDWELAQTLAQPCAAGALADADHDGDLDLFVTGEAGLELFNNNRDGSFRRLAAERGIGGGRGRQVVVTDLDSDRDLDVLVVNDTPPHDVWRNDLTWTYGAFAGLDSLRQAELAAVTVFDADADGLREIYGVGGGTIQRWRYDGTAWSAATLDAAIGAHAAILDAQDVDGDQRLDLIVGGADGWAVVALDPVRVVANAALPGLAALATMVFDPGAGPALVTVADHVAVVPPGPGRFPFLTLTLSGRSEAEQMRSNASGIGTLARVRANGRWTVFDHIDANSGPGQSLAPRPVGLGGHHQADFLALEWSDGVTQTELDLAVGTHHAIEETQRQLASCPVLFAWNGESFAFVSDVLGGAALGYLASVSPAGAAGYAPPRPVESYLLGEGALVPRDGRYQLKLAEPMEENVYLDAARLTVYDLPAGWDMVLDERLATAGAPATGAPIYFERALLPVRATRADGTDVTALVLAKDSKAPEPGPLDARFIGLLAAEQRLTVEFAAPLPESAVLVADGWIEYPYSQTVFAAWQAGARYEPPTLEARGADGAWHVVQEAFGYPAGMPRTMAFRLAGLPAGVNALRIASNMEIYWDRIRVVEEASPPEVRATELGPVEAKVARTGFAKRTTGPQRLPHYDYDDRATYWDAKLARGFYTAFGDASELVAEVDGALAIFGSGEEAHLEFPVLARPPGQGKRYYAVRFHGWAKDLDPYTQDGRTVGPLPSLANAARAELARRDALHARHNVRFQADDGY